MSIAATVILYNPTETVANNIQSYAPFVKKVYVIDNSEKTADGLAARMNRLPNCVYFSDGENKGIARRLNQACALAKADGHTLLLTMDQDSAFSPENITRYFDCIDSFPDRGKVAMFGIEFQQRPEQSQPCTAENAEHLITSGSVVNLSLLEGIGGFDENLFIDMVDVEYCYRSIMAGYGIIRFAHIFMEHHLGTTVYKKSLKDLRLTPRSLHAPVRIYYVVRNYLHVKTRYGRSFRHDLLRNRQSVMNRIKNNLLYNRQRLSVLRYILKGWIDFKKKRMGKISE